MCFSQAVKAIAMPAVQIIFGMLCMMIVGVGEAALPCMTSDHLSSTDAHASFGSPLEPKALGGALWYLPMPGTGCLQPLRMRYIHCYDFIPARFLP
jgi:hypothetical protein